jgi:hypothetical protein
MKYRVKIFEEPDPTKVYAIGADVAEGLEHGDFSTAFVVDKQMNQVASFCGHLDPDLLGGLLCRLGKMYNNALLAPEINNHGHATLAAIKNGNYRTIYYRLVKEELGDDYTKKFGWHTNVKTKSLMLDEFVAAYRDKTIRIRDPELYKEMLSITIEPNGDVKLNGKDRVVSACIALQAIKQAIAEGFKAYIPNKHPGKISTKVEKLKYYENKAKRESQFE